MLLNILKISLKITTKLRIALNIFVLILLLCTSAFANDELKVKAYTKVISENQIDLHLQIPTDWKLYAHEPGDIGVPIEIKVLEEADKDYTINWPKSLTGEEKIGNINLTYQYYSSSINIPIIFSNTLSSSFKIYLKYGLCNTSCIIERQTILVNLSKNESSSSFSYILIAAFLGGLILNLMPCVLPVLALKAYAISTHRYSKKNTLYSVLGIISSFLVLSIAAIILKHTGQALGWGIHFQNYFFTFFLAILMLLFGLYLLLNYTFTLPSFLNRLSFMTESHKVQIQHFASGVVSVVFATPCTAPFLGAALAYAVSGSEVEIVFIFLFISLGFSSPYFAFFLTSKPSKILPKPGAWLGIFKKILSIPMFASAIWLFYVSYNTFYTTPLALNSISTQSQVEELLSQHHGVLINVSANWCLTCQYNEHLILNNNNLRKRLKQADIIILTLDYSSPNSDIQSFLNKYKTPGIPFSIIVTNNTYCILPELLTFDSILKAISQVS